MRRGEDQHLAADRHNCSRWFYQLKEKSKDDPQLMKITDFEWCRIMRRRTGKSQQEIANEMETTRVWVNRLESGFENCDDLIWYWEQ